MTAIRKCRIARAIACCAAATGAHATDRVDRQEALLLERERPQGLRRRAAGRSRRQPARTEISAKSGLQHRRSRARADRRANAPPPRCAAEQARSPADADAARRAATWRWSSRTRPKPTCATRYGERIDLLDDSLKASELGEANLRQSLVSLLARPATSELAGKPVPPALTGKIRGQHDELVRQTRILAQQQRDRAALDGDLATALERYRAAEAGAVPPMPPARRPRQHRRRG